MIAQRRQKQSDSEKQLAFDKATTRDEARAYAWATERDEWCSVDGCDRLAKRVRARLCEMHYTRLRRTGSTEAGTAGSLRAAARAERDAEMRALYESGLGTVEVGAAINLDPSQVSRRLRAIGVSMRPPRRKKVERPTYSAVHQRIYRDRGRASDHLCACGRQAQQWAYRHDDPHELLGREGPYSSDPARYDPMCVSCHKLMDLRALGVVPVAERPKKPRPSLSDRYWAKVERGAPDECWGWTGATSGGYGVIRLGARGVGVTTAARVGYELAFGRPPAGSQVRPKCGNRSCQNPSHLELVAKEGR